MKKYNVFCGEVNYGNQFAESEKEAIRFTRMELLASYGNMIPDEGWRAVEIIKSSKRKPRRRSAMDIAADACGLVKVRVNGKTFYE